MNLHVIKNEFCVCKVENLNEVNLEDEFCFVGKTDEELSVVCDIDSAPVNTLAREDGWRAFRVEGTLDFSLIGILSQIAGLLAKEKISIFAVSTYNTDYILTKTTDFEQALKALKENGYSIQ